MAKLTPEQEQAVRHWAAAGASLNEIQDRLRQEHDLTLTYLDARLLLTDLAVKLQEKKKEAPPEPKVEAAPAPLPGSDVAEEFGEDEPLEPEMMPSEGGAGGGRVNVSIDQLAMPGAMVSGKATFSDGKSASWYLDQFGRLGLQAPEPGYKPPAADIPVFQRELDLALQRAGY